MHLRFLERHEILLGVSQSHMPWTSKSVTTTVFITDTFSSALSDEMMLDGKKWVQMAKSG